jgi:hypothetical protein|tara:strand:- start:699 stop:863 length:165 start_codon:yes stop_codon:yes gene_type:complete
MASPFILWLWPRCANKIKGEDMKDEESRCAAFIGSLFLHSLSFSILCFATMNGH